MSYGEKRFYVYNLQQKEKDKAADKSNKKQRSMSTSVLKNNNNISNVNSSLTSTYSLPNDNADSGLNNNNNGGNVIDDGKHWNNFVCETVVLVLNESVGLHFEVVGGADEGRFPYVGSVQARPEEAGISVQSLTQNGAFSVCDLK